MSDTNPYDGPVDDDASESPDATGKDSDGLTGQQAYNVVSDTVVGANLRMKDNVFQAIAIFISVLLGAGIGALVVEERLPGILVGAFIGLVAGLLLSGIFLMIFRGVMHMRGRHD